MLINILRTNFSYKHHFVSFFYVHVTRGKLPKRQPKQRSYEKFIRKMLMKLTTDAMLMGSIQIISDTFFLGGGIRNSATKMSRDISCPFMSHISLQKS